MIAIALRFASFVTLLFAAAASAAPITVQYNITGGNTAGVNGIGAITGGTLVFHFPNTGSALPPITGPASMRTLTLVGTAGTYLFPRVVYDSNAELYFGRLLSFVAYPSTLSYAGAFLSSRLGALRGEVFNCIFSCVTTPANQVLFQAYEIRGRLVDTPEPVPGALLSAGLLLLAAYAVRRFRTSRG